MDGARSLPRLLPLLALTLPQILGVEVHHSIIQTEFYQKSLEPPSESSEFMFDFDGDEIFHVENEETVWRLPEFQQFASFEAQGALQNIAIDKQNLENSMAAYNNSRAESVGLNSMAAYNNSRAESVGLNSMAAYNNSRTESVGLNSMAAYNNSRTESVRPEVAVFPKHPVEQDEPNLLICSVTKFWPPVLGLAWFRNGARVTEGVLETPIPPNSRGFQPNFGDIQPQFQKDPVRPEVAVFPKHPVEQDEPNLLICSVTKFWPPVLGLAWFRNGARVTEGVLETPFYPDREFSFRKFSYLPFIPEPGDYYDCRVEHEALPEPLKKHWEPQIQGPASEATETAICALGLAVGIVGIAAGTALIIRGMKLGRARPERGML